MEVLRCWIFSLNCLVKSSEDMKKTCELRGIPALGSSGGGGELALSSPSFYRPSSLAHDSLRYSTFPYGC